MAEMTNEEKLAYGLITTAGREDEFKKRIDELVERRQAAEEIEKKNQEERDILDKLREDTNLEVAQKTAALNKAQQEHDEAADEAHKRITLAQSQQQELEKLKGELDVRHKDLEAREKALGEGLVRQETQAKMLTKAVGGVSALKAALDEVRRQASTISEALG
jgi:hypothetical protein